MKTFLFLSAAFALSAAGDYRHRDEDQYKTEENSEIPESKLHEHIGQGYHYERLNNGLIQRQLYKSNFQAEVDKSLYTYGNQQDYETSGRKVVIKEVPVHIPQPYPVTVNKEVKIEVPQPYPVPISKPYPVPVHVKVPVHITKPYPVEVIQKVPVRIPVYYKVPHPVRVEVPVERPYPIQVVKHVPVNVPTPVYVKVAVPIYTRSHQYETKYSPEEYAFNSNYAVLVPNTNTKYQLPVNFNTQYQYPISSGFTNGRGLESYQSNAYIQPSANVAKHS